MPVGPQLYRVAGYIILKAAVWAAKPLSLHGALAKSRRRR